MYKKIGILGGLTPESTVTYYQHIVRSYQKEFGDHSYPEIIIYSVSFQEYEDWMTDDNWDKIEEGLLDSINRLSYAGADFAVIATNTMHILFENLEEKSPIPLISIIDATAETIKEEGIKKVGMLGTRFTMERPFYKEGLQLKGVKTIIPEEEERRYVDQVVFEELSKGELNEESRKRYLEIIDSLIEKGAEGIVLGCTEIPLLVKPEHTEVKLFDTAVIHAEKALEYALGSDS
ncbi:MAG: aspartate/glutamate racemase family protein [Candidatus Bathyarchaeia archaeon]